MLMKSKTAEGPSVYNLLEGIQAQQSARRKELKETCTLQSLSSPQIRNHLVDESHWQTHKHHSEKVLKHSIAEQEVGQPMDKALS